MAVRNLMKRDVRTAPEEDTVYLFSGFLRCGDCGQNMVRKTIPSGKKKYIYYVCSTNKSKQGCSSHSISETVLTEAVLQTVQAHIDMIVNIERLYRFIDELPEEQRNVFNYDAQIVRLKEEIERAQRFKMRLYENLSEGMINQQEYFQFKNSYTAKIEEAQEAIAVLEKERSQVIEGNRRDSIWIGVFTRYANILSLDRKAIVELIDHIDVYEGNRIEITFKYEDECARAIKYIRRLAEQVELPMAV